MSVEQIQALVDALAERLRRAVVVDDQDLRLVAVSKDFGDADPARIWSLLHRRTRPEDVHYEKIRLADRPGMIPENPELELWQRLFVPIRCQGLLLGFLWITDRYADLRPEQIADAVRTAHRLADLLHRRRTATRIDVDERRRLVEQLLDHDDEVRTHAALAVQDRGLLDGPGQLAVLMVEGDSALLDDAAGRLCSRLTDGDALIACGKHRATAVLQLPSGDAPSRLRRLVEALTADLTARYGTEVAWRVGVSSPAADLDRLPGAARQAALALSVAEPRAACLWPESGPYAVLAQLTAPAWPELMIPPGVTALLSDPSAAVLVPTLETFLDCAGDVQRTARELCVHRTTLYYRLGRAEQISGLSLRNGRDRLLLHLVLGLRRLHTTAARSPTDVGTGTQKIRRRAG